VRADRSRLATAGIRRKKGMIIIRRIIAAVSAAVVLAAGAGPAWAGEFNVTKNGSYVQVPPKTQVTPTIVRVTAGSTGFDWGDAGIGAGAGIAISIIVLGGGMAASGRRTGGHIRHA
jgi:hypothetical protein